MGADEYQGLLSKEENSRIAIKNQSQGVVGLSTEQRSEAGKLGVIAKGQTPYSAEEINDVLSLSELAEYQIGDGKRSLVKIAKKINSIWGNNRTNKSIDGILHRTLKKLAIVEV